MDAVELAELVEKRIGNRPATQYDKVHLIIELLEQDAEESIRAQPIVEHQRTLRRAQSTAAMQHNNPTNIPFFRLPAELRNVIYELIIDMDIGTPVTTSLGHLISCLSPPWLPRPLYRPPIRRSEMDIYLLHESPLIRTCRLFGQEARGMYCARQASPYNATIVQRMESWKDLDAVAG
ncbi:hypothetical protein EJ03DRAFT_354568 [Teratosphaeria nubilosa]|uniref:Uncharacterized protein n=1 Tax=Teratosphaeria nubilosa TaxID=161662 RepID=A0A6G1KYT0_9PEZI|nr:hypothetical protein EJ03DRAFT_354568 [Teratosphaeria nubilosa]